MVLADRQLEDRSRVTVYLPDNSVHRGLVQAYADIVTEFVRSGWLFAQLFRREFVAAYKQSLIGFFWAVALPLVSVGTFVVLNRAGMMSLGTMSVPYPLFAVLGVATWQLFATGLVLGSASLVKAGPMITKINFSRKTLVLASCSQAIIPFIVQTVLAGSLFVVYGFSPHREALWALLAVIPLLLLTSGLGLLLALLNGLFRDVGNLVAVGVTFLMFLTPVLYARPRQGALGELTTLNPLYYLVNAPRELVLEGRISEPDGYILVSAFSVVVFLLCLVTFHLTETRVAERV